MSLRHEQFACLLATDLRGKTAAFQHALQAGPCLRLRHDKGGWASLDLTPPALQVQPVTAARFFSTVETLADLLAAYHAARRSMPFEDDMPSARGSVYADRFLHGLLSRARDRISADEAGCIARWVSHLDVYAAVKAVESLLGSYADRCLLRLAPERNWSVHFDHLAIRCGTAAHNDVERLVRHLIRHHGYALAQARGEDRYRFEDGWSARPLYKMLANGQLLRLFLDQSEVGHPAQIIQHWHRVYGYTAHHLALRASRRIRGRLEAVPLTELVHALQAERVGVMTATGGYTHGLLEQVFTQAEKNPAIPARIRQALRRQGAGLEQAIENGKLLELVSRREMEPHLARRYFDLYGLCFGSTEAPPSAPVFHYFLPAQAAHVIRTSVEA